MSLRPLPALSAALLVLLAACPSMAGEPVPAELAVDHVGVGAADLDAAMTWFAAAAGVEPVVGGSHPGRGTRNALVSLGEGRYLEILAPDPAQPGSPLAAPLLSFDRPTPVLWALGSRDLEALAERLRGAGLGVTEVMPGSREKPDGGLLAWRTLGVTEPSHPLLPFFIEWAEGSAHPSSTSPAGCTLLSVSLRDPRPEATRELMGKLGVAVEVAAGEEPKLSFTVRCPGGELVF